MKINQKYVESFLTMYLLKENSFLALDFNTDDITYLLKEELDYINKEYGDYFLVDINNLGELVVDTKDFENILDHVDKDVISSIFLLQGGYEGSIFSYIDMEFSKEFREYIYLFFKFIEGDRYSLMKEIDFLEYFAKFENFKLRKMLIFIYYGIANDSKENTTKSIDILTEVIDRYPNFASFYLLRMRQTFNLVYKILIGVNRFNKLIDSEKGKKFIYNYQLIKDCFLDLDRANKLLPNYNLYYFFKGKFLLHLLDSKGLEDLLKYLEIKKLLFDMNVYSWFGVYYLQIGNTDKAKKFLEFVNYGTGDRYKAYSKLIFLYLKSEDKKGFLNFVNDKDKKVEVLLYNEGKYYRFKNGYLSEWEDIDDSYDHRTKMGYYLPDFPYFLEKKYNDRDDYLDNIFKNISRNYYDHWYAEGGGKVVFYSEDAFTFGERTILQRHDNK